MPDRAFYNPRPEPPIWARHPVPADPPASERTPDPPNNQPTQPPAPPAPLDHAAALNKYLTLLDRAIDWCLDDCRYDRGASATIGARLIKVSASVGAALRQTPDRQFTHRIVVEHLTPPHHPAKNLKTIHGGSADAEPQDEAPHPAETETARTQG